MEEMEHNIFQVSICNDLNETKFFLNLPQSEFYILDLLQRHHIEDGFLIEIQHITKSYIKLTMLGNDVFKINKLAQRIGDMTEEEEVIYENNIKFCSDNGIMLNINNLLNLTTYHQYKDIMEDELLGRCMAEQVIKKNPQSFLQVKTWRTITSPE